METTMERTEKREWIELENQGQKIFGMLHLPVKQEVPAPIIVILHGFASSKLGTNRSYVTLAENFAKNGLATLRFDFRGSGDSEGSLSEISFYDLISDALCVYRFIDQIESVDSSRMGVFGTSLGGAIALLSAKEYKSIKTIALWAPVASGELWYRDFINQQPDMAQKDPKSLLSYRGLNQVFCEQFGQMNAAKALEELTDIPFIHLQGENDPVTSLDHQNEFQRYSAHHRAEKKFLTYPNTEHYLGKSSVFPEVIKETARWFKKHL